MMRYPGGKLRLMKKIDMVIRAKYPGCDAPWVCAEPFVGGGGSLINEGQDFRNWRFHVNDLNRDIHDFWAFFSNATDDEIGQFLAMVDYTTPTIEMYNGIYASNPGTPLGKAFRIFFLNKTSYGGYVTQSLPIGGKDQSGKWKVGCYWGPGRIRRNVESAHLHLDGRILSVSNLDFEGFLGMRRYDFIYADPPYIAFGKQWYDCSFGIKDLARLINAMDKSADRWCLSIDSTDEVRELLKDRDIREVAVKHTAKSKNKSIKEAMEIVAFKE